MSDFTLPADAHIRVRELHDYWRAKRGGRRFPARADIDPIDIPRLLAFLTLVDIRPAAPRFVYRVVGTEAARLLRRDLTGQAVGTGVEPSERTAVLARYERVVAEGCCIYQRTMMQEENNDFTPIDRLMLPLGPTSGQVTQILSLITPRDGVVA